MPGVVAPDSYPIRDPRDTKLSTGKIANPPRMIEMGGLDAQKKWDADHNTSSQDAQQNRFGVEKPTRSKMVHSAEETDDD